MKRFLYTIALFFFLFSIKTSAQQQCDLLEIQGDTLINCFTPPCVTLSASVMEGVLNETNSYQIYAGTPCPRPPVSSGTPTYINADDDWSAVIPLPFTFHYFGQEYNTILIGDNGVVSFETNLPGQQPRGFCAWQFNVSAPSPQLFKTTIFGAYHDLYTPAGGSIVYYVSGTYPQRKFVIDFQNVAHYQCHNLHTTQRIILHETSNAIDVEIIDKPTCYSWNNGNALIALQNQDGTVAFVPPGRNTGNWSTSNESWRFVPNGTQSAATYTYRWYEDVSNTLLATTDTLQVCPDTTTTYRLELEIHRNNSVTVLRGTKTVYVDYSHDEIDLGPDLNICTMDTIPLDATVENATFYQWYKDGIEIPGANDPVYEVTSPGIYVAYAEIGRCSTADTIQIRYSNYPQIDLGEDIVACEGDIVVLDATPSNQTGYETYVWERNGDTIPGADSPLLEVTSSGTYVVKVTNEFCMNVDTVEVIFEPMPDLELGPDITVCSYETAVITPNILDGDHYEWYVNDSLVSTAGPELELSGSGEYDVLLTMVKGPCTVSDSMHVTILDPIIIHANPVLYGELEVNAEGGLPPYMYAINDGEYQNDNYFTGLPDDDYTVRVKDSWGCEADTTVHVTNLIFPAFFSPNFDGRNDSWRILHSELMPGSVVHIYDRFGRLIHTMKTSADESWDGTYNGQAVLSDDYWYVLILANGKIYKGHFSLLR